MARPASMFYWHSRQCFATDAGGKRTVLVKGHRTKANRDLAVQKLAGLIGTYPQTGADHARLTVGELVDRFLAYSAARVAAGELKVQKYSDVLFAGFGDRTVDEVLSKRGFV